MSKAQSNVITLDITPNISIRFNSKSVKSRSKVCGIVIYDLGNIQFAYDPRTGKAFPIVAKNPYLV